MSDFLSAYSIQAWLESCPQGYLEDTVYGHAAGEKEPEFELENPILHESAVRTVRRTPCIATRSKALLTVVSNPASSTSSRCRNT